ncbi:MAG: MotA/TolQ/ExbB proton channel family protein [Candidatus Brocadiaceae bacterium]|nr:MotA/TolQ/ExbB proton channel family protein [Candidatus Brocadiaceae bacterium]
MDPGALVGIILGAVLIIISIVLGEGVSGIIGYINIPSIMIVLGGTLAATLVRFQIPTVIGAIAIVKKTIFVKIGAPEEEISKLVEYCRISRREGLLGLEKEVEKLTDEFLVKAIRLLVDGSDSETLRDILGTEVDSIRQRHSTGKGILDFSGMVCPAFGMIGTLVGLIGMLKQLDDPSKIGGGMAIALITTLYGVIVANLILLPLAGRLETLSKKEILLKEIIIEGVISIQKGDAPMITEDKLKAFLDPKTIGKISETSGKTEAEKG